MFANPPQNRSGAEDDHAAWIQLTESPSDVKIFLDLMHAGKTKEHKVSFDQWIRVADLALKYECSNMLGCLASQAGQHAHEDGWQLFQLAARLDDPALAQRAVIGLEDRFCTTGFYGPRSPLQHITFEDFQACEPRYMFALIKSIAAHEDYNGSSGSAYNWTAVSQHFIAKVPRVSSSS